MQILALAETSADQHTVFAGMEKKKYGMCRNEQKYFLLGGIFEVFSPPCFFLTAELPKFKSDLTSENSEQSSWRENSYI